MKSFPPPHSITRRAQPAARPTSRPQAPRTTRSTVLLSLLLSPDSGNQTHAYGQTTPRARAI
jgi:hypothetical protein